MSDKIMLSIDDAVELIDWFEFCRDWFDHSRRELDTALRRFTWDHMDLTELRENLNRFADLLGHAQPAYEPTTERKRP